MNARTRLVRRTLVIGHRGPRSWTSRFTAAVALLSTVLGPLRGAVGAMAPATSAPAVPAGKLATDTPWAQAQRLAVRRIIALEGVSADEVRAALDGRAQSGLATSGRPAKFRLEFAEPAYLDAVGVYGKTNGTLTVEATGPDGRGRVVADGSLASGNTSWNRKQIKDAALTPGVTVTFQPAQAGATLRELELWGRPRSGAAMMAPPLFPDALYTSVPANARAVTAAPGEQTIALATVSRPGVGGMFTAKLDSDPPAAGRAFLVYDLDGLPHFTAALRALNGRRAAGRFGVSRGAKGGRQVEEIDPSSLHAGTNTIQFFPIDAHDPGSYRVRNLQIVLVDQTGGAPSDKDARAWEPLRDGVEGTGWKAEPGKSAAARDWNFASVTQPWALDVRLPARAGGTLTVASTSAAGGAQGQIKVKLDELGAGWHRVPLDHLPPTQRLTLSLAGGSELTASISELAVAGSPIPADEAPRLTITYPLSGECVNHRVHVRGFVTPAGAGGLFANGARQDGALDATGEFAFEMTEAQAAGRDLTVEARFPAGGSARQVVPVGRCIDRPPAVVATDGRPRQPVDDTGAPFGTIVKGGAAAVLSFDGAKIDIPAGAVEKDVRITIRPLPPKDLPPLDAGMTNVTPGAQAYRFGPLGMVFKKSVNLSVPYDRKLIPAGFDEGDVRTFYYDEALHRWEQVGLLGQSERKMVALSNHFTDFINATIAMPDHPGPQSENPTSLKGMKLADPAAGLTVIQPPAPNSRGTADVQFPIDVPPGRHGMQPSLALTYSSDAKNGWVGQGWDLAISHIEMDTRFGAANYNGLSTYLLDGEMLTPTTIPAGAPTGTYFARRAEGKFDWIQHIFGSQGSSYWLVTDKNGVQYTYGQSDSAKLMRPNLANYQIARWYLEKVQDPFGNQILYSYQTDSGALGTDANAQDPWVQVYPQKIQYTAHSSGTPAAPYTVTFVLGPRQANDVIVDGRFGFQVRTQKTLRKVDVSFQNSLIREYQLGYQVGDLDKTLLQSVAVTGPDTTAAPFYSHTFEYNLAPRQNGNLAVFASPQRFPDSPQKWDTLKFLNGNDAKDPLKQVGTTYLSNSGGVSAFFGAISFHGGTTGGDDTTNGLFLDLTGNGLPDTVNVGGLADLNTIDLQHQFSSFNPAAVATNLPLGHTSHDAWNVGGQLGIASGSYARDTASDSQMVVDMNGDGIPDLAYLVGGSLKVRAGNGLGGFGQELTWAYSLNGVSFTHPNDAAVKANQIKSDPVLQWTAPFPGQVTLSGALQKIAAGGDGVDAFIYLNANQTPVWQHRVSPSNLGPCTPSTANGCSGTPLQFQVNTGDQIFTRLDSIEDTAADDMSWNPTFTYTVSSDKASLQEPYGAPIYTFSQAADHRIAGRPELPWLAEAAGTVTVTGLVSKQATSDNATLRVVLNGSTELCHASLSAAATSFALNVDPASQNCSAPVGTGSISVVRGNRIAIQIVSDTQIDPQLITFDPVISYATYCRQTASTGQVCGVPNVNCGPAPTLNGAIGCNIPNDPLPNTPIDQRILIQHPQISSPVPHFIGSMETVTLAAPSSGMLEIAGDVNQGATHAVLLIQGVNKLWYKTDLGSSVATTHIDQTFGPVQSGEQVFLTLIGDDSSQLLSWTPTGGVAVPANIRFKTGDPFDILSGGYHRWTVGDWNGDIAAFDASQAAVSQVNTHSPFWPGRPARAGYPSFSVPLWKGRGFDFYVAAGAQKPSREGGNFDAALKGDNVSALRQTTSDTTQLGLNLTFANGQAISTESTTDFDLVDMNGDHYPDIVTNGKIIYNDGKGAFGTLRAVDFGFDQVRKVQTRCVAGGIGIFSGGTSVPTTDSQGSPEYMSISGGFAPGASFGISGTEVDFVDMNGDGLPDHVQRSEGDTRFLVRLNYGTYFGPTVEWPSTAWANKTYAFDLSITDATVKMGNDLFGFFSSEVGVDSIRMTDISANNLTASLSIDGNGGSLGVSYNVTRTWIDLIDLTGDGLPDQVMKRPNEAFMRVKRNLGDRFGDEEQWPVPAWAGPGLNPPALLPLLNSGDTLTFETDTNLAQSGSVSVEIIPYLLSADYTVTTQEGLQQSKITFEDIDGDGRLDHVAKMPDDSLVAISGDPAIYAKVNQLGPTNLLKAINRPLGGRIEISYARQGNQRSTAQFVDMPTNQYVMSKVTTDDGRTNRYSDVVDYTLLGPDSTSASNFGSKYFDRAERESYGYSHLTVVHGVKQADGTYKEGDGTRVERFYENGDFYRKGMLKAEYQESSTGVLLQGTRLTHADPASAGPPPLTGKFFPALTQRQTLFFEHSTMDPAQPAPKSRTETFGYDAAGNMTDMLDAGDEQISSDDIAYRIDYTPGLANNLARPSTITAAPSTTFLAAGALPANYLRRRQAIYNPTTGAATSLTNLVSGGKQPGSGTPGTVYNQASSTYTFGYDAYGNLQTSQDPTGYTVSYAYDPTAQTYPTSTTDSFSLASSATYDLRFGVPSVTKDTNNQQVTFNYDTFGRLCNVRGPDDQSASEPTISMNYGIVPSSCPNGPAPGSAFPTYAVTRHKDVQHAGDPIDTVTFVDGLGRVIETKRDIDCDPAATATPPAGQQKICGGQTALTTGMSVSGQVLFDGRGRVSSQAQPGFSTAPTTTFVATGNGMNPTTFYYDEIGRQSAVNVPDGTTAGILTVTTYTISTNVLGDGRTWRQTQVVDAKGNQHSTFADSRGNQVGLQQFNTVGNSSALTTLLTRYGYDPLDQLLAVTDAHGNITSTTYDTLGRMVSLTSPDAGQSEYRYDLAGNLKEKQTPNLRAQSRVIAYGYQFDRLTSITYPTLPQVSYTYGANTETGDANGNVAGRIKKVTYEAGNETRTYDHLGNVNKTVTTLNRMSTSTGLPATMAFTMLYSYDWLGRMQNMTFPNWIDQTYKILSGAGELVTYSYDHGGAIDKITGKDQTPNPQQTSAPLNFTYLSHIGYDEFDQRTVLTTGNGVANGFGYDPYVRRLTDVTGSVSGSLEQQNGKPPTPFHKIHYTYDKVGNIEHMVNNVSVQPWRNAGVFVGPMDVTYTYDNLYQLRSMSGKYRPNVAYGYQWSSTYTYSDIGAMLTKANSQDRLVWDNQTVNTGDTNPVATQLAGSRFDHNVSALTYSLAYQYTTSRPHAPAPITETPAGQTPSSHTYNYDANGNNTGGAFAGNTRVQTWDEESRLKEVDRNGGMVTKYLYDDAGERRKRQSAAGDAWYVNQYFVLLPNNLPTKHIFAGETRIASKTDAIYMQAPALTYYHPDNLGTTSYTTAANQDLLQHERYFAFGELWRPGAEQEECDLGRPDNLRREWTFTGKEWGVDESLYYFGARYFDPHTDVWQSTDPAAASYMTRGPGGASPKNLGLYSYSWNNPVVMRDPDGRQIAGTVPEYNQAAARNAALDAADKAAGEATDRFVGLRNDYRTVHPPVAGPGHLVAPLINPIAELNTVQQLIEPPGGVSELAPLLVAGGFAASAARGLAGLLASGEEGLVHMTSRAAGEEIAAGGILRGPIYAGPAGNAGLRGLGLTLRTGLPGNYTTAIDIPEAAAGAFSRPLPIGPITAWQRAFGTQFTAAGQLDLATGAFTRTGVNWNQALIYGLDATVTATAGGLLWYEASH